MLVLLLVVVFASPVLAQTDVLCVQSGQLVSCQPTDGTLVIPITPPVIIPPMWSYDGPPSWRQVIDQILMLVGTGASAIALGFTLVCTTAAVCDELNAITKTLLGVGPITASYVKTIATNAGYYFVWRFAKGKLRTTILGVLTTVQLADAGLDTYTMRKLGYR